MGRPTTSNTDGIVLMIMGFGYGVLAAWALFYEWGSAPSVKQVDLSAWIQAIGSIAAIGVAAAIPITLWRRDEASRQTQHRLKAKARALKLMPMIDQLGATTRQAAYRMRRKNPYPHLQEIAESLAAAPAWVQHYEDLEHIGHIGELIQTAILANNRLASLLDSWDGYYRNGGMYYDSDTCETHDLKEPDPWEPALKRSLILSREIEIGINELLEHHAASAKS